MSEQTKSLPARPNLEFLTKTAKKRLKSMRDSDPACGLASVQLAIAREYGFPSWKKLKAHVESNSNSDSTKFFDAIRRSDLASVRKLLKSHPKLVASQTPAGETPLHVAAEANAPKIIELLLAKGVDPSTRYGESAHNALSWSLTTRAFDAAKALIRGGVRPDLFCAAGLNDVETMKSFFDDSGKLKPGASISGSSRFAPDGTRLPRPPSDEREIISDALYLASRNGQADAVRFLLSKNPDLNFRGFIGGTPLHWAYFSPSKEVIDLLLAAGADPTLRDHEFNAVPRAFGICVAASWGIVHLVKANLRFDPTLANVTDGHGRSPAELARKAGNESLAALLSSQSPDEFLNASVPTPEQGHRDGRLDIAAAMLRRNPKLSDTNVYTAAVTGNHRRLKEILKFDPAQANQKGGVRNWSPLCYLTMSRFLRIEKKKRSADFLKSAKVLLDAGADPDSHWFAEFDNRPEIETALYGACGIANDAKITKLLLDRGAKVGMKIGEHQEGECLYHASEFSDLACLKLILQHYPKKDRMISYCMGHKMDMEDPAGVKLFLKFGADPNFLFDFGQMKGSRQLHFAIDRGRSAKIVKILLDAGADPNLADVKGLSPYAMALRYGRKDVARLLLKFGAKDDLNLRDQFIAAVVSGDAKTARKIVEQDPNLVSDLKDQQRELMIPPARADNAKAIQLMLDLGFGPNDQPNGWSPLHAAAWDGRGNVVRTLLEAGADPQVKNSYGGTALGTALHGIIHGNHKPSTSAARILLDNWPRAELPGYLEWATKEKSATAMRLLREAMKQKT